MMYQLLLLVFLLSSVAVAQRSDALEKYMQSLRTAFDAAYPSLKAYAQDSINASSPAVERPGKGGKLRPGVKRFPDSGKGKRPYLNVHQKQLIHDKRCFIVDNSNAVEYFLQNSGRMLNGPTYAFNILMATPCIGSDSLGNNLGAYFENLVCAQRVGLHYFSAAHIWEPSVFDAPSPFLAMIPDQFIHPNPVNDIKLAKVKLKSICKCPGSCHERPTALWPQALDIIKPILWRAVNNHLQHISSNDTVVQSSDLSNAAVDSVLPLAPEAAIHYRCGDNFIGHYGMLPFHAFKKAIPTSVTTIYVLAESRDRKTGNRQHLAAKCDMIFDSMLRYLVKEYPKSTVLIRRGDNLYTDFARLALAKYVVCSVSTFCLWPAVMNKNGAGHVYFPKTRLIVQGNTAIDLGFSWLEQPEVVLGQKHEGGNPRAFVKILLGEA